MKIKYKIRHKHRPHDPNEEWVEWENKEFHATIEDLIEAFIRQENDCYWGDTDFEYVLEDGTEGSFRTEHD